MTDKEMLELAAKACGFKKVSATYHSDDDGYPTSEFWYMHVKDLYDGKSGSSCIWNPLTDEGQRQWMHDLYDAADALERAPRWRDVAEELPQEAQEVLFVRDGKTVHGAWIGGIFWHSNQKMAAAIWMPLPVPPND